MSDPIEPAPPPSESGLVSIRVSLLDEPNSVAKVADAIASAGGRVRSVSTLRTLPEVDVMELELCVEHLNGHSVAVALKAVAGILQVAPPTGAPLLERRLIRIGGKVRWPEGSNARERQR